MATELTFIDIPPAAAHQYTVIWLHGLGADGHDFEGIVHELSFEAAEHTRFIFPNAPIQPVTINQGMKMRAWYDILEATLERKVDIAGIYSSADAVSTIITQELSQGIDSENILLAGFSQGGVVALHTGLRFPKPLAGIVALSTYLPTVDKLPAEGEAANAKTPIFMAHGILDSVVPIETAKAAFEGLTALHYAATWQDYVMGHSVCAEEIQHISLFFNKVFQPL